MTGEATLMGDVLPVGGVRTKLLAAERAGLRLVLLPHDNLADVPDDVGVEVRAVSTLAEVADALGLRPSAEPFPVQAPTHAAPASARGGSDA